MNVGAILEASRHLCEETRVVLTSLRGGPPNVARGDLAQDLADLRHKVKNILSTDLSPQQVFATPSTHQPVGAQGQDPHSAPFPAVHEYQDVGPYARPFLAVVMDPRAAGPHTLVALRALHRLLERGSLKAIGGSLSNQPGFGVAMEPLTKGVLNCKFEQTDAGADEAVEMAIADLLALMVTIDRRSIQIETLMDAFNTVFVTRNTFVHSPALCYHFEDVLTTIVRTVFEDLDDLNDPAGRFILEFLVNQLLHTPLVGGDDDASREAQMAHDATRVLCLRLSRCALLYGLKDVPNRILVQAAASASPDEERGLLQIVQDDLCLSLLLTGQAIWAYHSTPNVIPGLISLEVLSEICSTMSTLWTSVNLRKHLVPQFEAIFTGFYQRALALLRKRQSPTDSASFHANLSFDAGIEIILESLVEIMCLHDSRQTVAEGDGGCLETLFATYDCNIKRSDVGVGLMIEMCRCVGSKVDQEGDIMEVSLHGTEPLSNPLVNKNQGNKTGENNGAQNLDGQGQTLSSPSSGNATLTGDVSNTEDLYRKVPPHLKELCAESIIGSMKCLFQDDRASESTKEERRCRDSIMKDIVSPAPQSFSDLNRISSSHRLRNIKSKKRLMRKAARLFNIKSSKGIEFLVSSGIIAEPVTPRSVASFLRNGLVVGLDKKEVGVYLGELGKPAVAGKSPKVWERDWFHKEVLEQFCSLFHFERQSLLDGLRMFLAAFRLPGEAQQISRIVQAFADSCGNLCEESKNGALKLFSDDPQRASDVAFLLSFSIIMLNTDQHNDNIREDRRMKKSDFVRNNKNYGKGYLDPGKELPREYLESIFDSIREEEIKTEGEGADGSMTVERWKDVLRGSADEEKHADDALSATDAEDLSELVLEQVYMPIMSSISALWGVQDTVSGAPSGMHGAQGARLGMDIAWEMLMGVRQLGRNDIFCKVFKHVCKCSGLLNCSSSGAGRSWAFTNSVEAQGAAIVALHMIRDANSELDQESWKYIWAMILELRDLKMLGGASRTRKGLLKESDPDLLTKESRRGWAIKLMKKVVRTSHGKENLLIWDDLAPSDDEDEHHSPVDVEEGFAVRTDHHLSIGRQFENQLIQEDMLLNQAQEMPVTGLESLEDTRRTQITPRARVRKRLSNCCDFVGLVSDSRFMDDNGLSNLLQALLSLISQEKKVGDGGARSEQIEYPLSPASEAFAEVLICEIALKNRDRLAMIWYNHLGSHYYSRLDGLTKTIVESEQELLAKMSGSIEKAVTGLLRVSCFALKRGEIANDVISTWSLLDSCVNEDKKQCLLDVLDRHIGEGLWRITRCIDDSSQLSDTGWHGILSLIRWCVYRAKSQVPSVVSGCIHLLVITGDKRNCPKLSVAGLDLLQVLNNLANDTAIAKKEDSLFTLETRDLFWKKKWLPVIENVASVSDLSPNPAVRQHALSILTDSFLDKEAGLLPVEILCEVLGKVCVPLAADRIIKLRRGLRQPEQLDVMMVEVELCVSLLFKPLRHHMKSIASEKSSLLLGLWLPTLTAIKDILAEDTLENNPSSQTPEGQKIIQATNELIVEHLKNVIMVLISFGVLGETAEESSEMSISAVTWASMEETEILKKHVNEWKSAAANPSSDQPGSSEEEN
eukprot:jgi/Psemu1/258490/estExt_Genewise1Plus.C_2860061